MIGFIPGPVKRKIYFFDCLSPKMSRAFPLQFGQEWVVDLWKLALN
jgi:hypothetical protein